MADVKTYIVKHQRDKTFWTKAEELLQKEVDTAETDLIDVSKKYSGPDIVSEDVIRAVLEEQGFSYITSIMDTITGFQFNRLMSFMDLINQLKGTRDGLELVLKLLGFDSIINEWWEDSANPAEPWTYEIIVLFNTSIVPDIFETLKRVQEFSRNYVYAKIANVEIRFLFGKFAEQGTIMAGFSHSYYGGRIVQRAI